VKTSRTALAERTRDTTEGALLAALTALVAFLVLLFGQLGLVAAPLPLFVLSYRRGLRAAVLGAVVAGLVLSLLLGFPAGLLLVAAFAPMGIVQGTVAKARKPSTPARAVGYGFVVGLGAVLFGIAVARLVMNVDPFAATIDIQVKSLQSSLEMARRFNMSPSQTQQLEYMVKHYAELGRLLLPGGIVLGSAMWSYGAYTFARIIMARLGTPVPGFPPILQWRLPSGAGLFLIAPILLGVALQGVAREAAAALTSNAFILSAITFAFFGILTLLTYLNSRDVPKSGRIFSVLIVFMLGDAGLFAMVILGLLDVWFDFRRARPRAPQLKESVEES
jgi:uncharacterized protein YybS (DUF2232 family)